MIDADSEDAIKIIFLDMDGVLCNPRACLAYSNTGGGYSYLDPVACMLVRRLCESTGAKLVISSAWRILHDRLSMEAILDAACPNLGRHMVQDSVYWCTSRFVPDTALYCTSTDRGREVMDWVTTAPYSVSNFVVLDDMADVSPVMDNLVRCDLYDGMGWQQYHDAEKLLMACFCL
jgi:hypothetical protein